MHRRVWIYSPQFHIYKIHRRLDFFVAATRTRLDFSGATTRTKLQQQPEDLVMFD
jgi:hypothetical protein